MRDGDEIVTNGGVRYRLLYPCKKDCSEWMCRRLEGKGGTAKVPLSRMVEHIPKPRRRPVL
jgi:hypothetical protein